MNNFYLNFPLLLKSKIKINLTGPESSGKTSLAQYLSLHFDFPLVTEYAREYLVGGGTVHSSEDLVRLGHQQINLENLCLRAAALAIVCDTDLLVLRIWSKEVFHKENPALYALYRHHRYDLTLLCSPDVEWQPDPLRVNPKDRQRLFDIYYAELKKQRANFWVIEGTGPSRNRQGIKIVDGYLKQL